MAYRKLEFGDHVRIVNSSHHAHYNFHNAIVINEDGCMNKVQVINGERADTFWIHSKCLIVRDDKAAFIVDGKFDNALKAVYDAQKEKEKSDCETIQYNPNRLTYTDEYGDNLEINYFDNSVVFDMFGEQLVFDRDTAQNIVDHLNQFLKD